MPNQIVHIAFSISDLCLQVSVIVKYDGTNIGVLFLPPK